MSAAAKLRARADAEDEKATSSSARRSDTDRAHRHAARVLREVADSLDALGGSELESAAAKMDEIEAWSIHRNFFGRGWEAWSDGIGAVRGSTLVGTIIATARALGWQPPPPPLAELERASLRDVCMRVAEAAYAAPHFHDEVCPTRDCDSCFGMPCRGCPRESGADTRTPEQARTEGIVAIVDRVLRGAR